MLNIYGYLTSWAIYLAAGTICYVLFYRATAVIRPKTLANVMRGIMIALIYTPWYISADNDLMAPVLMVITLDMITLGGDAFIRGFVPLLLALSLAILAGLFWNMIKKKLQ
ncbi:hypothetical protein [Pseudohongiella spirulinae]|uniref:Uncharacterized protein n=1 Tax=Pseudohongiella spirulinae TaxID=1249552 RepID=A0A0S2KD81_9GAMM|nr:hypothetical protein [Pseudohongiella spirulinae]ALO46133.1 hypothetical protein PS2015_1476 [Pseudohongiella spirulinae]